MESTTEMSTSAKEPPPADFYIAGASKSGTTSLFQVMRSHPQLFFPINKEPHFFSWGQDSSDTREERICHATMDTPGSIDEYHALFSQAPTGQLRGEASTSYLSHPEAARRIAAARPDARIILILRHPVERAYSAYQHFRRDGREPEPTLEGALANESSAAARLRKVYYLDHGLYSIQIQRYLDHFPEEQLRIFLYEELIQKTQSVIQDIYRFLNVASDLAPASLPRLNRSGSPRLLWIRDVLGNRTPIHDVLRRVIPHGGRAFIRETLESLNTRPTSPPPVSCTRYLTDYYRDDLERLGPLIQRNLESWTNSPH